MKYKSENREFIIDTKARFMNHAPGNFDHRENLNFTIDEIEHLRSILHEYGDFQVFAFIAYLEEICRSVLFASASAKPETYERVSRTDHKNKLADTIKILEAAAKCLDRISKGKALPYEVLPVEADGALDGEDYCPSTCRGTAAESAEGIKKLLQIYKNAQVQYSHAPKPGTYFKEIAAQIVICFEVYLGKPTAQERGPFCAVLEAAFKAVGLPLSDPKKLARKVVKPRVGFISPGPALFLGEFDWSSYLSEKGTRLPKKS